MMFAKMGIPPVFFLLILLFATGCAQKPGEDQDAKTVAPAVTQIPAPPQAQLTPREEGKRLFDELGCVGCHAIFDRGGALATDLTDVGSRRSPEWIRQKILDPASLPPGQMPPLGVKPSEADALVAYLSTLK